MTFAKPFLITAVAVLAISCSQTPPANITKTVSNTTNSTGTPQTTTETTGKTDPKGRLQTAGSIDMVETETGEVYATNCMICHKDTGKGGRVTIEGKTLRVEDLTSDKMKKHSDEKLFEYISEGVPDEGMPAFKDKLSEDQIRTVIAHVRGLQSK